MPKSTISVTIDTDILFDAKRDINNISAYINECLRNYVEREKISDKNSLKDQLSAVNNSICELKVKKSILEMEAKRFEEIEIEKKRVEKENERFRRWICSVCHNKNIMENDRCGGCNMRTRNDKKTTIIMDVPV